MIDTQVADMLAITTAHKKVATKLCGVSETDRHWILSRLAPEQRSKVQAAYAQLQSLRGDVALDFGMFFDTSASPAAVQVYPDPSELTINNLDYEAVKQALTELSAVYVVSFLRTELWLGSSKYWKECSAERVAHLESLERRALTRRAAVAFADAVASLAGDK
jgi:hypothetical protein